MTTFTKLCKVGKISDCKSYYEEHKNEISNDMLNKAFGWSCSNGHIDVAQWLYSLGNIDIHAEDEYAFKVNCGSGHIDIAQWLYSLGNINIHTQCDFAFRWSCESGHLDVAQWLYSLGNINIHAKDDYAFDWSCRLGHINVAKWLAEICPEYYLKIENNKIKSYKFMTLKDKIKDKTHNEIIQILNIKTSNEQISERCVICLDDGKLKLHNGHNHYMCFNCMIEWYINNDNELKCQLCKTNISYQNMTLFI